MSFTTKKQDGENNHELHEKSSELDNISDPDSVIYAWTDDDEKLLVKYAEECIGYEYLNNFSANIYGKREQVLYAIQLCLSTIATLSIIQNQFTDVDVRNYICIVIAVVNSLITAIQILNTKLKITENHIMYQNLAKDWVKLKNNIEVELHKSRTERTEKKVLIHALKKTYDELISNQLTPKDLAIQEFNKKYKDVTIHKPSILGCN